MFPSPQQLIPLEPIHLNRDGIRKVRKVFLISKANTQDRTLWDEQRRLNLIYLYFHDGFCTHFRFLSLSINHIIFNFPIRIILIIVTTLFHFT